MNIVIIAGSGGIGLAIVKQCLKSYPEAKIFATYYQTKVAFNHPSLSWHRLDASCEQEVQTFAESFSKVGILINASGMLHLPNKRPEKSLKEFTPEFFNENIQRNTLTSILLAKHFQKPLRHKHTSFFVCLSAKIGSIADNKLGGWLSYRTSKAALNMAVKTIAIEWQRTTANCCVFLFHPGTTDSKLSKPFQKGLPKGQLHSPEHTAQCLQQCLQSFNENDTGKFISYNAEQLPW